MLTAEIQCERFDRKNESELSIRGRHILNDKIERIIFVYIASGKLVYNRFTISFGQLITVRVAN